MSKLKAFLANVNIAAQAVITTANAILTGKTPVPDTIERLNVTFDIAKEGTSISGRSVLESANGVNWGAISDNNEVVVVPNPDGSIVLCDNHLKQLIVSAPIDAGIKAMRNLKNATSTARVRINGDGEEFTAVISFSDDKSLSDGLSDCVRMLGTEEATVSSEASTVSVKAALGAVMEETLTGWAKPNLMRPDKNATAPESATPAAPAAESAEKPAPAEPSAPAAPAAESTATKPAAPAAEPTAAETTAAESAEKPAPAEPSAPAAPAAESAEKSAPAETVTESADKDELSLDAIAIDGEIDSTEPFANLFVNPTE